MTAYKESKLIWTVTKMVFELTDICGGKKMTQEMP